MVYEVCVQKPSFQSIIADSKALTEAKREGLFEKLQACGKIGYATMSIGADDISHKMLRKVPVSLNAISHDAAAELVRRVLDAGVEVMQVYVDTVGDAGSYQNKLTRMFNNRIVFTVSAKADSLFKTVSAASICAKVTRDRALKQWVYTEPALAAAQIGSSNSSSNSSESSAAAADAEDSNSMEGDDEIVEDEEDDDVVVRPTKRQRSAGEESAAAPSSSGSSSSSAKSRSSSSKKASSDVGATTSSSSSDCANGLPHPKTAGSGYPGDPLTKAWLRKTLDPVFGWPSVMRFSWATAKDMLEKDAVGVTWEEDQEGASGPGGAPPAPDSKQMSLGSFFSAKSTAIGGFGGAGAGGAAAGRPGQRHAFFRQRGMELVSEL